MASRQVLPFFQTYTDLDGAPLENGYIYIGTSGLDPETNAITIYSDSALTTTVAQPVRTTGGFAMASGTQINIYANVDYSITIRNKSGALIYTSLTSLNPGGYATQAELDDTQAGAGLESDGGYTARSGTNFIDAATSLYTQGTELDTNVQTALDAKLALAGGTITGNVDATSLTPSGHELAKFNQIPTAVSEITNDTGFFSTFSSVVGTASSTTISTSGFDSVTASITIPDSDQNNSQVDVDIKFALTGTVSSGNENSIEGTATVGTGGTTIFYNYAEMISGVPSMFEGSTTSGTFVNLSTLKVKVTLASSTLSVEVESVGATDWTAAEVSAKTKVVKFS